MFPRFDKPSYDNSWSFIVVSINRYQLVRLGLHIVVWWTEMTAYTRTQHDSAAVTLLLYYITGGNVCGNADATHCVGFIIVYCITGYYLPLLVVLVPSASINYTR